MLGEGGLVMGESLEIGKGGREREGGEEREREGKGKYSGSE